jgi:hypothetical protein
VANPAKGNPGDPMGQPRDRIPKVLKASNRFIHKFEACLADREGDLHQIGIAHVKDRDSDIAR